MSPREVLDLTGGLGALDWLRYSLRQGETVSPIALKFIEEHEGRAYTLAPETGDPARLTTPRWGGVVTTGGAQAALAMVLETLAERGAACVVVEDEVSLKRHPKPSSIGLGWQMARRPRSPRCIAARGSIH